MALTDNILAYYKLDESSGNASDSVGSNTGVNTNVTYGTGKINNGAIFDASTDKLAFSNWSLGTGDWTIAFWLQERTSQTANTYFISGQSGTDYWGFYIGAGATNKIRLNHYNGTDNFFDSTATFSLNTWYYIAFTKSSDTITCYVNGSSSNSKTGYSTRNFNGSTYNNMGSGLGNAATAYQDELGVWTRALSGSELTQLYNSGAGLQYPFTTFNPAVGRRRLLVA